MYCPRCAMQNLDDAKFCRGCGANVSLVPQAMQGALPAAPEKPAKDKAASRRREKKRAPATIDGGLKHIFEGFGLFIIFLVGLFVFRGAFWLTVWFIIPALASVGEGIGELIRARQEQLHLTPMPHLEVGNFQPAPFAPVVKEIPSPDTREIVPAAASITEGTTRHLDAHAKRLD